jgi:predicted regulator of Ras-like GTPase activity (Roadblock/LC7/MglB family)
MKMEKILKDFERLAGIHHSCLLSTDEMMASTFPEALEDNLMGACRVIYQIFMAVEGMGCSHREIFIELEESLLIGYYIADETVLVLLTDKDVNLALINTSVRSSLGRIKKKLTSPNVEPPVVHLAPKAPINTENQRRIEVELTGLMGNLQEGLAEHIGPAAEIVFDDAYADWKATHGVQRAKIAELIKALAFEIEDKADRSRYLQTAVQTVRAFNAQAVRS